MTAATTSFADSWHSLADGVSVKFSEGKPVILTISEQAAEEGYEDEEIVLLAAQKLHVCLTISPLGWGSVNDGSCACANRGLGLQEDWKPTHQITFERVDGKTTNWVVMLDDEGVAYDAIEWQTASSASWVVEDGVWLCEGQATPQGVNGTVTVEILEN